MYISVTYLVMYYLSHTFNDEQFVYFDVSIMVLVYIVVQAV